MADQMPQLSSMVRKRVEHLHVGDVLLCVAPIDVDEHTFYAALRQGVVTADWQIIRNPHGTGTAPHTVAAQFGARVAYLNDDGDHTSVCLSAGELDSEESLNMRTGTWVRVFVPAAAQ